MCPSFVVFVLFLVLVQVVGRGRVRSRMVVLLRLLELLLRLLLEVVVLLVQVVVMLQVRLGLLVYRLLLIVQVVVVVLLVVWLRRHGLLRVLQQLLAVSVRFLFVPLLITGRQVVVFLLNFLIILI